LKNQNRILFTKCASLVLRQAQHAAEKAGADLQSFADPPGELGGFPR
jgi:hypothetical protein